MLPWYRLKERDTTYDLERLIEASNGLRMHFGNLKARSPGSAAIAPT